MPDKTPNAERWGGPGSSQQNADTPAPEHQDPRSPGTPTNYRQSHVSGGGGERDSNRSHDPDDKT